MLKVVARRQRRLKRLAERQAQKFEKLHVRKGDLVRVLAGKDRGKQGRIMRVFPERKRVLVEKLNMLKRHQRPTQKLVKGGIIEKEGPLHISNVMLVCPSCTAGIRPRHEVFQEKSIRVCRKCNEQIDKV